MTTGAQTNRSTVTLSAVDTQRVRRFAAAVGNVAQARARLSLSASTFDAARDFGSMRAATRERVLAALDEVGA